MGLFTTEDGNYQGWLAAFLCCFAAVNEDESPIETHKSESRDRLDTCNEQPPRLMTSLSLTSVLTLNAFKGDEPTIDGTRQTFRISEHPPSLMPLDLGEFSLLGPLSLQGNAKTFPVQNQRPIISAPFSFRRVDHTETQRQALIPLRLGPVVLREPLNANINEPLQPKPSLTRDHDWSGSTEDLSPRDGRPQSYRANRESPFQRCQYQSSTVRTPTRQDTEVEFDPALADVEEPTPTRPPSSTRSSSSSAPRQCGETPASSVKSRTSSERVRPKRKRSFQLVRRDGAERLEQEILELNTIIEERKAETARDNSPDQHVPAVAPSMQIRARSETLDAIGSALSRPLAIQSTRADVESYKTGTPQRPPLPQSSSENSWRRSRLSGWLFGILPSASPAQLPSGEPFYKCQPPQQRRRRLSEASSCTSLTELDSPSLTVASSPASRGHSRNLTDESWITPLSPILHSRAVSKTDKEAHNPFFTTPATEVGRAL